MSRDSLSDKSEPDNRIAEIIAPMAEERDRYREALERIALTWVVHNGHRQDVRYQECVRIANEALS